MKKITFILSLLFVTCTLSAEVVYLTTNEFKSKVFDYIGQKEWNYVGDKPCIIDFYTTWCGPCKRLAPIMEELSEQYKGQVYFYKVDTEKERELAAKFNIHSIPTIIFCPKGNRPQMTQGLLPKETLEKAIDEILLNKK